MFLRHLPHHAPPLRDRRRVKGGVVGLGAVPLANRRLRARRGRPPRLWRPSPPGCGTPPRRCRRYPPVTRATLPSTRNIGVITPPTVHVESTGRSGSWPRRRRRTRPRCRSRAARPGRPSEICERMPGSRSGRFITHAVMSVSISPGWTQFTRMPSGVISADMLRVSASRPSLVGA